MEMRTQSVDASGIPIRNATSSVAAKGSFARAGDENITIVFDYLFMDDPNAQIAVYLSDNQEPGVRSFEVARVHMPASGRPGAIGSNRFATFYGTFPRVSTNYTLNFTRGTYVELALIASRDGQNNPVSSRVWIDNFDPQIICSSQCADLSGEGAVSSRDYLLLMSEYGQTIRQTGTSKACLDSKLSEDQYIDITDILAFDTLVGPNPPPNMCGPLSSPSAGSLSLQTVSTGGTSNNSRSATPIYIPNSNSLNFDTLVIAGKSSVAGQQGDSLYTVDKRTLGSTESCQGNTVAPAGGPNTRSNGRLIRDSAGAVYQLNGSQGLVRIGGSTLVPPAFFSNVNGNAVHVGVNAPGGSYSGLPLIDAAFHPNDPAVLYVLPVLVSPPTGCPYKAAAKLHLTGNGGYEVVTLYGHDPATYSSVQPDPELGCSFYAPEPDRQQLREIKVDAQGHIFVLAAQDSSANNDWLLIYNEATGNPSEHAEMISNLVKGPSTMLVSSTQRLYLTSSIESSSNVLGTPETVPTRIYRFDLTCYEGTGSCLSALDPIDISNPTDLSKNQGFGYFARTTSIQEDPADGKIYVLGFTSPRFAALEKFPNGNNDALFTLPTIASLSSTSNGPVTASAIVCHNLALPLSLVFGSVAETVAADFNADGHVDTTDLNILKACETRSGVPYNAIQLPNGCTNQTPDSQNRIPADFDKDGDVDMNDFGMFQRCYSGSNSGVDPNCGN